MTLREQLEVTARQIAEEGTRAALVCFLDPADALGTPIGEKPFRVANQHEISDDVVLQRHLDMYDPATEYVVAFLVNVLARDLLGTSTRRLPSIVVKYQDQHT